jgi:riboflavin kinase/FMN adenylyltransferase
MSADFDTDNKARPARASSRCECVKRIEKMIRLKGFHNASASANGFLSIGNFDGVHLGHQRILETLVNQAREKGVSSTVLTFEPHPTTLLQPDRLPPRLTSADQKAQLIARMGVDVLIEYPTDWALLALTPREFFDQIVVGELQAAGLVEGPNFFFGKKRAGNVEILNQFCNESGRSLTVISSAVEDTTLVSSSLIRQKLIEGDLDMASKMLGRRYAISGVVGTGAKRGRLLGFPTANLEQIETLLPAQGVYAAWCRLPEGDFPTAVNIGPNPTFQDTSLKVEAHLIGFSGDLYNKVVELEFISRLRNLRSFATPEELQTQLRKDVTETKNVCSV